MPAILVITAHPDDEAFGPAGTIARYAAQGVPVDVLAFTRGQYGTHESHLDTPEKLGRMREFELRASCRVLGVRELYLLDYVDGRLDQEDPAELTRHVLDKLEATGADAVITFGPLGITRHADHIAVHKATMAAVEGLARTPRVFYGAVEGEWAKRLNVEGPEAEPTHAIDMSDYFETKLMALACHSSQDDSREFFSMLSQGRQTEEHFYRALPPAEPGRTYHDLFE